MSLWRSPASRSRCIYRVPALSTVSLSNPNFKSSTTGMRRAAAPRATWPTHDRYARCYSFSVFLSRGAFLSQVPSGPNKVLNVLEHTCPLAFHTQTLSIVPLERERVQTHTSLTHSQHPTSNPQYIPSCRAPRTTRCSTRRAPFPRETLSNWVSSMTQKTRQIPLSRKKESCPHAGVRGKMVMCGDGRGRRWLWRLWLSATRP